MSINDVMHCLTQHMTPKESIPIKRTGAEIIAKLMIFKILQEGKDRKPIDLEAPQDKMFIHMLLGAFKKGIVLEPDFDKIYQHMKETGFFSEEELAYTYSEYQDNKRVFNIFEHNLNELIKKIGS